MIGFEAHILGTAREIVNDDSAIRLAGVATHDVSFNLQVALPAQHTYKIIHLRDINTE